jgi:NAD-dependent dihydropyrimidine dehydrogenase PreA subunit
MERLGFAGSTRLRPILEELMTPEQARMIEVLPGSPEEVAQKTGIAPERVKDELDDLFFKGVLFPRGDFYKREYFRFAHSIIQLHDATMGLRDIVKDRKFYELWYDFMMNEGCPAIAKLWKGIDRPLYRIIPAYKAIKDLPGILLYENFPEILKAQKLIAAVPCPCRSCNTAVGKPCAVHNELEHWVCLQFGRGAEYAIARGSGKKLSLEEALELNEIIEESGLLHIGANNSAMTGINFSCQCCRDCCVYYVPMDQASLPIGMVWEKSRYQAYVNLNDCTGCQICIDRCLFDAIEMERSKGSKKYKAIIDPDKCFGCGVCVVGCESGAIKMKAVQPSEYIPTPLA